KPNPSSLSELINNALPKPMVTSGADCVNDGLPTRLQTMNYTRLPVFRLSSPYISSNISLKLKQ
ncbi:1957_t:CDS:1, partial [Gigaspora rosea]